MKEFTATTNQVLTSFSGMINAVRKEKKPMFMECNGQIVIISPIEMVRWKREPERILDNDGSEAVQLGVHIALSKDDMKRIQKKHSRNG